MRGIAIDFGSAYSSAARLNDEGVPTLIPDAQESDRLRTPSLVHFSTSGPLVGHAAVIGSCAQPETPTIEDAKSMLASGRALAIDQARKSWTADECAELLFSKLRQDADTHCFQTIDEVLLTIPSRFTSAQRQALRQAAQRAGLRVRGLIDECLAAAVYAASTHAGEQTVLVLQAGRCGFEAAIVRCGQGSARLLAARHDSALGGKAIDQRLADEICKVQGWTRESLSATATKQLLHFAEKLKIALCQSESSSASPSHSSAGQVRRQGLVGKATIDFVLTAWHFQQLVAPTLQRAFEVIEQSLSEAALDWTKIDRVVLAGGATQLPALRTELLQRSGLPTDRIAGKDCLAAVAYGAALLAAQPDEKLAQYEKPARYDRFAATDGMPAESASPAANDEPIAMLDVGIRIGDPRSGQAAVYKLIKKGTALPTKASKQFRTSRAQQRRLVIEAVKTAGSIRRAESLGHFALALPAGLPANHPVVVTMYCDATGQIRIDAESTPVGEPQSHRS